MIQFGRVIDSLTRVAPLGLRFWDSVSRSIVADGLVVTAYLPGRPYRSVAATTNRSGIYVLQGLPGMRSAENGAGDDAYWSSVQKKPLTVEVHDTLGRFMPFALNAVVPERGIYNPTCVRDASKPPSLEAVPLHSAPTRVSPGGMVVLRGDLWDPVNDRPAAWAFLEARTVSTASPPTDRVLAMGYADEKGRIALIFGYPENAEATSGGAGGSPPAAQKKPLWEQQWTVQISARYVFRDPAPGVPDLCEVHLQPGADLWADAARTTHLGTTTIDFGEELVLRTAGEENGRLLVTPV